MLMKRKKQQEEELLTSSPDPIFNAELSLFASLSQSILPVRGDHCVGDRTNIADFAKMSHFVSLVRYVVKLQIT